MIDTQFIVNRVYRKVIKLDGTYHESRLLTFPKMYSLKDSLDAIVSDARRIDSTMVEESHGLTNLMRDSNGLIHTLITIPTSIIKSIGVVFNLSFKDTANDLIHQFEYRMTPMQFSDEVSNLLKLLGKIE